MRSRRASADVGHHPEVGVELTFQSHLVRGDIQRLDYCTDHLLPRLMGATGRPADRNLDSINSHKVPAVSPMRSSTGIACKSWRDLTIPNRRSTPSGVSKDDGAGNTRVRVLYFAAPLPSDISMATVSLHRSELSDLPPVCVRCGCAATQVKVEKFSWTPQWAQFTIFIGLLPWLIFGALTRQKATVHLPFCDEHVRERPVIYKVVVAGFALAAVLIGLGVYLLERLKLDSGESVLLAGFAALGVTLLVVVFGSDGCARATLITATTIALDPVSEEFAEAVHNGVASSGVGMASAGKARGGVELQTAKYFRNR